LRTDSATSYHAYVAVGKTLSRFKFVAMDRPQQE
jgi:hypothetical protein